ncbi:MAG: methylenetetrahydrofolate--tRNA-(uracil(54)-C(5))-methyltransferase (FADH(2)-oxidizing) TrmFO [Nitrospirae bacterium]|nr:methylenetetrahydrofolate--tRNA-(uracil(54)-C(5))-methyltransferase (FADH(2)-oxidizing) TrmFO [Nitrospirota bacterium]
MDKLTVIGGGLAGCEAAWQAAQKGIQVVLYEMRPDKMTGAHKTGLLAELVCSNSLRSREIVTGPGLLKKELDLAGSLIMNAAKASEVSAGSALAVDRTIFSEYITNALGNHPNIAIIREEVSVIPDSHTIIATGPLTSEAMADALKTLIGAEHLFFYDAIAPIIDAGSIDYSIAYMASRYGKGGDDYVNCPMSQDEYNTFLEALKNADTVHKRDFEDAKVFEGCMPVEVMAERGRDTLRFGPLKPVGLPDPKTGGIPYAVVQLRAENREKTAFNMVGFQTRLRWPEQKEVFTMIPGLKNAEFLRLGSMHRNTYINAPLHLNADLSLKERNIVYLAGQITGVEGYIESTAMGLLAGLNAARRISGRETLLPPRASAHGSLIAHLTTSDPAAFQPSNINFGLIPEIAPAPGMKDKKLRRKMAAEVALKDWAEYINLVGYR